MGILGYAVDGWKLSTVSEPLADRLTLRFPGEMFPTHIRSKGYSLAMSVLALANVVYTQAAPTGFA